MPPPGAALLQRGVPHRVVPADGAHRRARHHALRRRRQRLRGHHVSRSPLPRQLSRRDEAGAALRRAAHVREDPQRDPRGARGRSGQERGVRSCTRGRPRGRRGPGARRHAGPRARARVRRGGHVAARAGTPAARSRRAARGRHRGGADPGRDPAVLPGARPAALGDVRALRVVGTGHLGGRTGAPRDGRARGSRGRAPPR